MGDEDEKKGFGALSSLTSKVGDPPAASEHEKTPNNQANQTSDTTSKQREEKRSSAPPPSSPPPNPPPPPSPPPSPPPKPADQGNSSNLKWFLGVIGVVIAIAIYNSQESKKPSAPTYTSSPSKSIDTESSNRILSPPTTSPKKSPPSYPQSNEITFERPPTGSNNVLSVAQIRWCVRAGIQIEAKRLLVTSDAQSRSFNESVDDYNSRCGSYRYRRGNLELATQQVNKQRSQIEREARQELSSIPKQSLFSPDISQPRIQPAPAPLTESKPSHSIGTVREAQKLLKDLGYDPGPIDGQMGPKTRTAIKSFQREAYLSSHGEIDQDFLRALRDAHSERQKFKSQQESRNGTIEFTVSEKQFLTIVQNQNGEMKLFDTTRVPFNTENSCYGWRMRINGISGSIKMREILRLPSKPLGGWPVITDGSKKVTPSSDGKSAVTIMTLEIEDGMVGHVWCIAEGDPIGDYSIDVFLNDVFVETFDFEVFKTSQQTPSKTQPEAGNSLSSKQGYIPENASVDYTGKGWTCDRGYRPDGDRCVKFVVPAHASVDYTGRDWTCDRGYKRQGDQCVKLVVPENASVDYTGRDWTCDRGYNQQGDRCIKFAVPENASVDYTGRDWTCDRGYNQRGDRCIKFVVPENASVDYTGREWTCDRGYNQQGNRCIKFAVPENASVDYTGRKWVCNAGYTAIRDKCVK